MLDTIGVNFYGIRIDQSIYSDWENGGRKLRKNRSGFTVWHGTSVTIANGATYQFTYFPYVMGGLLRVEFSLPHVVIGNNVQMVFNIKQAVDIANQRIPEVEGIPPLDLWEGKLFRLDICYNHYVGNLVPYYINALQHLEHSRRKTLPYSSEGVMFKNKQRCTKFYDKEKECLDNGDAYSASLALGDLRHELSLRKRATKGLIGKECPTLKDINLDMLVDALEDDLQQLGLLNHSIGTADTTLEHLISVYSDIEGLFLYGWLMASYKTPSKESLQAATKAHPKKITRRLAKIVNAGLPLTVTTHIQPLIPLKIDREMILSMEENCICPQCMGDTPETWLDGNKDRNANLVEGGMSGCGDDCVCPQKKGGDNLE